MELSYDGDYRGLLEPIAATYNQGRLQALRAVDSQLVETNWRIGRYIVEFEQRGEQRADYGAELIKKLARDLTRRLGKGFSRSNLIRIRQFYLVYPKGATVSHLLSWSLGYFANEESIEDDNPPIGIILSGLKDELMVGKRSYPCFFAPHPGPFPAGEGVLRNCPSPRPSPNGRGSFAEGV